MELWRGKVEAYIKQKQHFDQGFKHFRVRQLLKEDAGSGVRADDSGVGVFIIFVNIMILAYSLTNTIVIIIISILTMTITKVTNFSIHNYVIFCDIGIAYFVF